MKILLMFLLLMVNAQATTMGSLISAPKVPAVLTFPNATIVDDPRDLTGTLHLSLEEMKKACTDPHHYNNQNPPTRISVDCIQKTCQWGSRTHGNRPSERVTYFGGRVQTDKANVHMDTHFWKHQGGPVGETVPCFVMQFYCQRETVNTMLSCEDLIEMDSLKGYCENSLLALDIESFSVKVAVGQPKFLCPGLVPSNGHSQK
ncbi:MAG: hypothetical protein DRI98_11595 [Bacteroidetes bacterium]|nr:MAG: hypothetical protein DRI98_11595 [Bacteroidota bacterium]